MKDFRYQGLEKLANSDSIKKIYPMVDHIEISQYGSRRIGIDIFLNDGTITKENMYDKEFDPHYLVAYHLKNYYPYFGVENTMSNFIVYGPDGDIVYSED